MAYMSSDNATTASVRISRSAYNALKAKAEREGRKIQFLLTQAVREFLNGKGK